MSHGGIIISSNSDGRGMMLPEREGSYTFNKLPFISMSNLKNDVGLNPTGHKVIINKKKLKKLKEIIREELSKIDYILWRIIEK